MHLLGILDFTSFVTSAGYAAIFTLSVLQSCCVPTSSEITLGFAGVLAAQGKLSLPGVIVAGVAGEVVGAYVAWMIGRYAGRAAVDRFGRYFLLSHRDLDRAGAWYDRHERFGVFGSRLLPVIRNFVALPAGIAEVPLVRFGALTAAGSLLWDGAWAGIGYGVGAHWHTIASGFNDIGYVLAVVAVGVIGFGVYHRYRSYRAATDVYADMDAAVDRTGGGATPPPPPAGAHPAIGAMRWVSSSSGRPPASRPVPSAPCGTDRWVTSSSGHRPAHARRSDFPRSPIAAWEAAVLRGRPESAQSTPRARLDDRAASSVGVWTAAARSTEAEAEMPVESLLEEDVGVESNGRLTAMLGALLLALLAVEGATILRITPLLTVHVVIGMVLVPVVLLKVGSATWRFARYYLGSPAYRRKGPPPAVLRLLGPFIVVSTFALLGSGIALLLVAAPTGLRTELLLIHKVSFVLWFAAMAVHVIGHLLDMAHLAPRDFYWRTRRQVRGAGLRQWAIVGAVCVGILLAAVIAPKVGPWLAGRSSTGGAVHAHAIGTPGPAGHASETVPLVVNQRWRHREVRSSWCRHATFVACRHGSRSATSHGRE